MDKTYWIVRWKATGHISRGGGHRTTPALYRSRGIAIAARKAHRETDEQFLALNDVIPVKLSEVING